MTKHATGWRRDTPGMLPTVRYAVDPGWFAACWWDVRPDSQSRSFVYARRLGGLFVGAAALVAKSAWWNRTLHPRTRFAHRAEQM